MVVVTLATATIPACGGGRRVPGIGGASGAPWFSREPTLRVGVSWSDTAVDLGSSGRWWIRERDSEQPIAVVEAGQGWGVTRLPFETGLRVVRPDGYLSQLHHQPLIAESLESGSHLMVDGVAYPGEIELLSRTDGSVTAVNVVALERYLEGVVARELSGATASAFDALRAQAVAARTYALKRTGSRAEFGFDLYGSVLDQAYKGIVDVTDSLAVRAVRETAGEALLYNGMLIDAYYHSTCGGHTAAVELVFDDPPAPYLVPVSDARPDGDGFWCQGSRYFRWTREFDLAELEAMLARNLPELVPLAPRGLGSLRDLEVLNVTPEGRVVTLAVTTSTGRYRVSENEIRILFADANGAWLRSTQFLLRPVYADGQLRSVTLVGGGWGHGVGMCQVGAMARAKSGQRYDEILSTYYPGTTLTRVY